jgi:DNA-binding transcriptional ArsR family regulator
LDTKLYEDAAKKLKILAHPYRLCIIKGLLDGGCNVSRIQACLQIPQSTVSQHLGKLKDAGIIEGKRKGTEICYQVVDEESAKLIELLVKSRSSSE